MDRGAWLYRAIPSNLLKRGYSIKKCDLKIFVKNPYIYFLIDDFNFPNSFRMWVLNHNITLNTYYY